MNDAAAATVGSSSVLSILLLCGLMGLIGQGARAAVGLKAMTIANAPTHQAEFNAAYLVISLMIGFIAGILAGLSVGLSNFEHIDLNHMTFLLASRRPVTPAPTSSRIRCRCSSPRHRSSRPSRWVLPCRCCRRTTGSGWRRSPAAIAAPAAGDRSDRRCRAGTHDSVSGMRTTCRHRHLGAGAERRVRAL
jgi:hypothetical protein